MKGLVALGVVIVPVRVDQYAQGLRPEAVHLGQNGVTGTCDAGVNAQFSFGPGEYADVASRPSDQMQPFRQLGRDRRSCCHHFAHFGNRVRSGGALREGIA